MNPKIQNIIVHGPAIAIRNTWAIFLPAIGRNCIVVDQISDIEKIKPGDYVLLTFDGLDNVEKGL